jgi:hypothetical protein
MSKMIDRHSHWFPERVSDLLSNRSDAPRGVIGRGPRAFELAVNAFGADRILSGSSRRILEPRDAPVAELA